MADGLGSDELHQYWKDARRYFLWRHPALGEWQAEDFASFCVLQKLKGTYEGLRFWQMRTVFFELTKAGIHVPTENETIAQWPDDEQQEPPADFASIMTLFERRAMLRDLDRHVVRPRQRLREQIAAGEHFGSLSKEEQLQARATELLEELRAFERAEET